MVDRIPKVESNTMKVLSKEDTSDEHGGQGKQNPQDQQEEHDQFAPKLDFNKWTGDKTSEGQHHPSLWDKRPASTHSDANTANDPQEPIEVTSEETTMEEVTTSTTITFLRAVGFINKDRHFQWGTIGLYFFAIVGIVIALSFVIRAFI